MKILISGTHFTPAQAVIEELKKDNDIEIVYLGRKYTQEGDSTQSVESKVLPKLGVRFIPIISGRLQRSFTRYTIPSLFKIPIGLVQSFYLVFKENPDVVLLFGGYVAVPVSISSWLLSKPILIHEQTLVTGLANQISGFLADKVAVSFESKYEFDPRKVIMTGNPIRSELLRSPQKIGNEYREIVRTSQSKKLPLMLVVGGNQGSHTVNLAVEEDLNDLLEFTCVVHQTGDSKYEDYERLLKNKTMLKYPERYLVTKWIEVEEMGYLYRQSDFALSRAGINTLYELAYFTLPTILVPIPYIHKNEQVVNASFFEKLGLAKVLPQSNLVSGGLVAVVKETVHSLASFKSKARKSQSVVILDAAKRIALEVKLLGKSLF